MRGRRGEGGEEEKDGRRDDREKEGDESEGGEEEGCEAEEDTKRRAQYKGGRVAEAEAEAARNYPLPDTLEGG